MLALNYWNVNSAQNCLSQVMIILSKVLLIHPPIALIKSNFFLLSEELSILCDITNHLPSKKSPGCLAEGRLILF